MATVYCGNSYCLYNNNGICTCDTISIDDECESFKDYSLTPEYQNEHWICVKVKGKPYRRKMLCGKKISINGIEFITANHPNAPKERTYLTDIRTGISIGNMQFLIDKNWNNYIEKIGNFPNVMDLEIEPKE